MFRYHLVRLGAMGQVGRFASVDAIPYPRGCQVVVRTSRGLELGQVLSPIPLEQAPPRGSSDGSILRQVTVEDQLLQARLDQHKREALNACAQRIQELGLQAVLLDAELLFDGSRLYFYFLGNVEPELEQFTEELASLYETSSQIRRFAETIESGCGPGCGTDEATGGCGSSCSSCGVASACGVRSR